MQQETTMLGTRCLALTSAALVLAMTVGPARARGASPPAGWSERVPRAAWAREHYVGPEGEAANPGTTEAPWDLASALAGRKEINPGDDVWVRGGTYKGKHELTLAGREGAPIHVRAYPGERATLLDGTLQVSAPARHVWVWDLEITTSTPPEARVITEPGSHPPLPRNFPDGT